MAGSTGALTEECQADSGDHLMWVEGEKEPMTVRIMVFLVKDGS
jgi:hypothetical protein